MKILAFAHDPGGANAVAATVARLQEIGAVVEAYAKGPAIRQFQRLGVAYQPVGEEHQPLFVELDGDVLLTGTSQVDEFERDAILWARKKGIPSIAVIDYWANYLQRFQPVNHPDAKPIFPDTITAIDETCAAGMIAEGLPSDRIRVVGQPYFAWLVARQKPQKTKLATPQYVLFASQYDANEVEILRILIEVLAEYKPLKKLLIRFHPRQNKCPASLSLLAESGLPFAIDESTDVLETIQQQDIVLGITSIILIEAALMGIASGSLIIGVEDTLMTNKLGVTYPLTSPEKLQQFLYDQQPQLVVTDFCVQQRDADLRIAQLVMQNGNLY
ncbi:hypothetical protein NIES2100_58150 [Calothrix sp. NIES-2100]|uniref:hypothetical protein n=1 Tax=Calothrix sp. NIES-2100 TaxID=1954172 RepID=UPI000B605DC7|nr:hypothetical protein NIES2100_58150 [Calothrix sp. NIES-2100]